MSASVDHLLADLRRHHVEIERRGDRLKMRAPAAPPSDLFQRVKAHTPELLLMLPDAIRLARAVVRFRLTDTPSNTCCAAIGACSRDELVADVLTRWPHAEVLA